MHTAINEFNQANDGELIGLKIGIHWGACLAVTLNERLDYFGQTVNLAARVQALSGAHEIVVTDAVLGEPGRDRADGRSRPRRRAAVSVKGVASELVVHHLQATLAGERLTSNARNAHPHGRHTSGGSM